jgi:hypothetical protein
VRQAACDTLFAATSSFPNSSFLTVEVRLLFDNELDTLTFSMRTRPVGDRVSPCPEAVRLLAPSGRPELRLLLLLLGIKGVNARSAAHICRRQGRPGFHDAGISACRHAARRPSS